MADDPFLLTPGPVPVPPEVLAIQSEPQMHHRSAAFVATYGEVLRKLKLVYRTAERRAPVHGLGHRSVRVGVREHGRGGRSRSLLHGGGVRQPLGRDGARVRRRCDGSGGRVGAPARSGGDRRGDVRRDAAPGRRRAFRDLDGDRDRHPGDRRALARAGSACWRSTPSRASARCRSRPTAGASTSWSRARRRACPRRPGSRSRASRRPPGSAAARPRPRASTSTGSARSTPRTAAAARSRPRPRPCAALDVALDRVLGEGLEAIWERTRAMAGRFRARVLAEGLELYSPDHPSCSLVTAIRVPEGVDADELRKAVLDRRLHHRGRPRPDGGQGPALRAPRRDRRGRAATPGSTRCWPRCRNEPPVCVVAEPIAESGLALPARGLRGRRARAGSRPQRRDWPARDALVVRSATQVDAELIASRARACA